MNEVLELCLRLSAFTQQRCKLLRHLSSLSKQLKEPSVIIYCAPQLNPRCKSIEKLSTFSVTICESINLSKVCLEANRRLAILESSNAVRHALHTIRNTMQNLGPQISLCSPAFLMAVAWKLQSSCCVMRHLSVFHCDMTTDAFLLFFAVEKMLQRLRKTRHFISNHLRID